MRRRLVAVTLVGLLGGWGARACAGEVPPQGGPGAEQVAKAEVKADPTEQYLANRWKDFLDIFDVKLALGDCYSVLFHVRATRLAQIGAGRFAGTKIGFQGPCAGVYGEGRVEGGISVFYWAWIGRKASANSINAEAEKTNCFFGRVDNVEAGKSYREFEDANRPWHTIGASFALPFLPGLDFYINPAEAIDFVLSLAGVPALRIPPPFNKIQVNGEMVPNPNSIRWHGQEQFEKYD
jgi:hypothetical protein